MNLRELRKLRGLTQEELAEKMCVHENTIRLWEKGINEPRLSDIKLLCEILRCTESELLNGLSSERVELVLSWDWDDMKKGEIRMNENKFKLVLGDDGMIGLNGAGRITSTAEIEEFLGRVRKELEIALEAQIKRGVVQ